MLLIQRLWPKSRQKKEGVGLWARILIIINEESICFGGKKKKIDFDLLIWLKCPSRSSLLFFGCD